MTVEVASRQYAGFWRRTAAALADGLFFLVISGVLLYAIYGKEIFSNEPRDLFFYGVFDALIDYLMPAVISVFFWTRYLATPGKMLLGCQVVDAASGKRLTLGQAALRYVCYVVSALPLGLGFLWVAWDKRKQGFHDKLAKTVVVTEDESLKALGELEKDIS